MVFASPGFHTAVPVHPAAGGGPPSTGGGGEESSEEPASLGTALPASPSPGLPPGPEEPGVPGVPGVPDGEPTGADEAAPESELPHAAVNARASVNAAGTIETVRTMARLLDPEPHRRREWRLDLQPAIARETTERQTVRDFTA
jgi:hypothetical protein